MAPVTGVRTRALPPGVAAAATPEHDGRVADQEPVDLQELAAELLAKAATTSALRAARTLPHPVDGLRQTVLALIGGTELSEHEAPGPASLQVLRGRARLAAGPDSVELAAGQVTPIPQRRHSVHAEEDAVLLLTVAVPDRAPQPD
jgi:quercetin dioxygenase-like cupin family protein